MALLDVTSVLTDPDFVSEFTVERRIETVDNHGRSVQTIEKFSAIGVVTASSPNELERPEEYEKFGRAITVVTKSKLRGAIKNYQPDIIVWLGNRFVVKAIDLYPQFGAGFYQIEAEALETVLNGAPVESNGALAFNLSVNSGSFVLL